jgi:hypothetical protein
MNAQTNTLFNTLFSQRQETPLTSALNIIQRYNRNLEDYNRNIENYNINFERIIPLHRPKRKMRQKHSYDLYIL